ncbi:MAG: ATP-binding protein [Verrucomicrobiota bacterium]|jgi:signal transduction histidine kinase/ActR/RegA family two-component response regulator/HAMP domain-containing protein
MQLVGSVFLLITPAWLLMYIFDLPMGGFVVGVLALAASWFGGEHFILREVRALSSVAQRIAEGDLSARTGLKPSENELGQLTKGFDLMAESLERLVKNLETAEKNLLNRTFQQTVVAALGQFALTNSDLEALLNQTVMLVAQTLGVEYSAVFEQLPAGQLRLQAGVGWKPEYDRQTSLPGNENSPIISALKSGDPVVTADLKAETRISASPFLAEHGVVSGVTVAIPTHDRPYGILGIYSTHQRKFNSDEVQFLMAAATAIGLAVERKRADAELQKLAAFVQLNPDAAMELNVNGTITYFNEAAQQLATSVQRNRPGEILPPDIDRIIRECLASGQSKVRLETKMDGRTFSWSVHPVLPSNVVHCYVEDITERLSLEAQLRQAQKMESIGQLAAGVAHDFNNMLTIIQGHSSSLLARPALPPEVIDSVQAVYFAAERAAGLTRQLLMFSRKNVMQPELLDLQRIVGNMSRMLERLLGETITLEFQPAVENSFVQGDCGMIEQVVMNLSLNARDAMPRGGRLTIGIETVDIDAVFIETHPQAHAGRFVRFRVTDTGTGMDSATLGRIFEPFFTTKDVGKGTGLGLATVYGIVKQHEGWVEVNSEPGKGSTFDVFLPAGDKVPALAEEEAASAVPVAGGSETILIVEDEPVLRSMARDILEECGYRILEASSGKEALDVWNQRANEIDLLLTDMVMPDGVSGADLVEKLQASQPRLKVVFTSGYTANEVNQKMLSRTHASFLAKPYTHAELAKTVRDCLDQNNSRDAAAVNN